MAYSEISPHAFSCGICGSTVRLGKIPVHDAWHNKIDGIARTAVHADHEATRYVDPPTYG